MSTGETHETWLIRQCDRLLADPRSQGHSLFEKGMRAALIALRGECAKQPQAPAPDTQRVALRVRCPICNTEFDAIGNPTPVDDK